MLKRTIPNFFFVALVLFAFPAVLCADSPDANPAYWKWASTPPMGWNSYDAWGSSVTEKEVLANARYLREYLLVHGWKYVVIDFRWYDSVSPDDDRDINRKRAGAKLFADECGRLLPATNRFPSALGGKGFKPLADKIHAMGLKFGIHMMRGIPRQAVRAKSPIEGSRFTAADAGNTNSTCGWCPDMFGVRDNAAGQAWYDSCARLWASWGVDFVKVDDLSVPYRAHEIEMIRKAIDQCGRPIVFSTSPGPTSPAHADHISKLANMWRISGDFWDRWPDLNRAFDLFARWQGVGGPGHWPDLDMIPFGHIGIQCTIAGPERQTRFSRNEEVMLMSFWALAPSPLMLGANLPDMDGGTLSLLTNDEVLAVNQDPLGDPARRVMQAKGAEVWVKGLKDGSKAIGLFNRGPAAQAVTLDWNNNGLSGNQTLRNLWSHQDLGTFEARYLVEVPRHGAVLLRARPAQNSQP
ncbi:MAG TPA: glycoside hydrolase family 27 protein [Verrucomicrobiae bacterium]|nr:glycoside hydrolase family 27 protein [Verrucomicrobiae bacterium]